MLIPTACIACLLAFQESPDVLLPPTPEGWRYERLDLPPAFAPDLEYPGFEELRFAPGMFEPESDWYFSYVFALRMDGDVPIDTGFVRSFLDAYYRGLCATVAESRNLELDLSKIAVEVTALADHYVATVNMVDAFVTGEPLTLRMELFATAMPRTTDVLALASPQPADAAVWTTLHELAAAWRSRQAVSVFFNHAFISLDEETYAAVAASDFLRETFAIAEERTTVRGDMSYTGVYLYGDRTYFEFLGPGLRPPGYTGLAFGFEAAGTTDGIAARLKARDLKAFRAEITREAVGGPVPWFTIMGIQQPSDRSMLDLFSLEYDASFLERWHPGLPPAAGGITRRQVLDRYAAKTAGPDAARDRAGRLFRDVTEVHLALDEAERGRLIETCTAFGYDLVEVDDTWTWTGPQYRIVIRPSDEPGGITALRMSLRRPVEKQTITLGKATLRLDGETAMLEFGR